MFRSLVCACVLNVLVLLQPAAAHYLWVQIDAKDGEHGTVNLYFEEGPRAGDGQYLDPFVERGKYWLRTPETAKPAEIELSEIKKDGKRWLSAKLSADAPRGVDSYGKWGVYRYGQTDVLLHYYARTIEAANADQLKSLSRAEQLQLDIVPRIVGDDLQLQVLWQGKAAAGKTVYVRGAGVSDNLTTDDKGIAQFTPSKKGTYLIRTFVEEADRSGTDDGKEYQKVRHNASLTLQLPLSAQ